MEDPAPHPKAPSKVVEPEEDPYTRAINRFGFRLLAELWRSRPDQNVLLSPAALGEAITLAGLGASGETRHSILGILNLPDDLLADLPGQVQRYRAGLCDFEYGVCFDHSTAFWPRKGLEFRANYLSEVAAGLEVEWYQQNYSSDQASALLRDWLVRCGETRGVFQNISLDPLSTLHASVASALRGGWQTPFEPEETVTGVFDLIGGLQKRVRIMTQSGWFAYDHADEYQMVELPLGDGRLRFVMLLPDLGLTLGDLVRKLVYKRWEQWRSRLVVTRGEVALPRTLIDYTADLSAPLSALGMGLAFDEVRANFEEMCAIPPMPDISLGSLWHSASLELVEDGAPGAPGLELELLLDAVHKPFKLSANRPFFFTVEDQAMRAILLLGVMVEPK